MDETKKPLLPKEAAALFGRHKATISRWRQRGVIKVAEVLGGGPHRKHVTYVPEILDEKPMSEATKHPDIFTAEEAIVYMHLDPESGKRTLQTLRENGLLQGIAGFGKALRYHRKNLDACIERLMGIPTGKRGR